MQPEKRHLFRSALAGGFIVCLTLFSGPAEANLTEFTVVPLFVHFYLKNENSTGSRVYNRPYIECTVKGSTFESINITRTLLDNKGNLNMSTKEVVMTMISKDALTGKEDKWTVSPRYRGNKTRYIPSGSLYFITGLFYGNIRMAFDHLTCPDQSYLACELSYKIVRKDKGSETLMYRKSGDYLNAHAFGLRLEWIDPPSSKTPLKNGTNVKVKCTASVGTLNLGGGLTRLVWTYVPHNKTSEVLWLEGREWAKAMEYGPEKEVYSADGRFCSVQQEVTLSFTVTARRDSNRIYYCAVRRISLSRKVEYLRFYDEDKQYIKVPDFYPPPQEIPIGTLGFLGAATATIAFLVVAVFFLIWCFRVLAKKKARVAELDNRKAGLDTRRLSIVKTLQEIREERAQEE